ncbi:hypothetical protein A9G11_10910 [Gilliamella sp. wkB108]|uniref:hypothetical protein n=1 Tax=Gilliamella sp. wkB108 TaxID=3120256 RepID=UPI00080DDEB9|nr:hypothetical protein [Gilliamella apicola]OCG28320.1 hypothetical protein A9G11_10910 [Gilliamella apicola]
MKISNILTCAIVSILVTSCAKKTVPPIVVQDEQNVEVDQLTFLKQQTEQNNSYVVNAKKQLLQLVGDKNFDSYITKHGILACNADENPSACVLSFYLQEYYKLKYDVEIKKIIEESEADHSIELSKIEATEANINNYCRLSADFVVAIYSKDTAKITKTYQPLFKMSDQNMSTLNTKVTQDNYSHFLIDENPSITQELKTDYVEKCLTDPKTNIINYFNIFR